MRLTDEEGSHDFNEEFLFEGVTYEIEGTIHNTKGECEKCDHGFDNPTTGEDSTDIELLSATFGTDNEFTLEDIAILKAIETELYNHI